ncbi:hypothetical protein K474DRAFT_958811 [Panus rudis PR-1116 ss-1]|nr:hypothetical protein K474DRAFT_958811 [Panus rudis PR-1116 ss-1]
MGLHKTSRIQASTSSSRPGSSSAARNSSSGTPKRIARVSSHSLSFRRRKFLLHKTNGGRNAELAQPERDPLSDTPLNAKGYPTRGQLHVCLPLTIANVQRLEATDSLASVSSVVNNADDDTSTVRGECGNASLRRPLQAERTLPDLGPAHTSSTIRGEFGNASLRRPLQAERTLPDLGPAHTSSTIRGGYGNASLRRPLQAERAIADLGLAHNMNTEQLTEREATPTDTVSIRRTYSRTSNLQRTSSRQSIRTSFSGDTQLCDDAEDHAPSSSQTALTTQGSVEGSEFTDSNQTQGEENDRALSVATGYVITSAIETLAEEPEDGFRHLSSVARSEWGSSFASISTVRGA